MPVSSVPPPTPAPSARGTAAARPESPLPLGAPAAAESGRTAPSGSNNSGGNSRSTRPKGDKAQANGAAASGSSTSASSTASPSSAMSGTGSSSTSGAGTSSFGQTLNATLSATAASAAAATGAMAAAAASAAVSTTAAGSNAPLRAGTGAPATTPSASASRNDAANASATSNPARLADETSAARSAADAAANEPGTGTTGSASVADSIASDSTFNGTAKTPGAALAQTPTPAAATTAAPSAALSASPPSLASDSAANSSTDAGPDAATLATASHAPTPMPLLTQLSQALGESNGTGKATSEQNLDDATGALGAPPAATDSSVDATSQSGTPAPSAAAESQTLHAPVGTAAWGNELGARLTVMAQQGVASASLRLSPAHLGPLDVRIAVRDNSATVYFGSQQADTRAALEQALPRLRELFAQQGLNLTHAGVSGETPQGTPQNSQAAVQSAALAAAREVNVTPVTSAPTRSQGLIDTYA